MGAAIQAAMKQAMKPMSMKPAGNSQKPEQYEIEDAANTLMKAQDIQSNPKLMPHVEKHLRRKKKATIETIADIRAKAKEKAMEAKEDPAEERGESAKMEASEP